MFTHLRLSSLSVSILASAAAAQTTLQTFEGNSAGIQRGFAVAGGYDFDADGFDDVVVGSPFADTGNKTDNGAVHVYSGRTGAVIHVKVGDDSGDRFGYAVALAGDVDGDGVFDVVVGAPRAKQGGLEKGMARVFSGATSATLRTWYGLAANDEFGWSVSGAFDSDNDNDADVIVGAPLGDNGVFIDAGYVSTFSGGTGALLLRSFGVWGNGKLGTSVAGLGDVDNDGRRDFAAGAPGYANKGRVTVWDGASTTATPVVLWELDGATANIEFGTALAGRIDVDNDAHGDIVVGARAESAPFFVGAGSVRIVSGATGAVLRQWFGDTAAGRFGSSVAVAGNFNNVNGREILVGAPASSYARVFDSASGETLMTVHGVSGDNLGACVADGGDVNSDGTPDFLVGTPGYDAPGMTNAGRASVVSSSPWFVTYCTAGTSTNGCTPEIGKSGSPSLSATSGFLLTVSDVEGQKTGLFFYGLSGRQAVAWGASASFLCVKSPTQRCTAQSTGGSAGACNGSIVFDWLQFAQSQPGVLGTPLSAGQIVQTQCWYRDPPSPKTTQLSNALEFSIAP